MSQCTHDMYAGIQCCGSVTFWYGSESADPCLRQMDPDPAPDPAIFVSELQDSKKPIFSTLENRSNQCFSYYFCLVIKGSGSGYVPLVN